MSGAGRRTRRQWGWHPLRPEWARRIVADAAVEAGDLVVDLGAGTGALTGPLLDVGATVVAVELHPGRASALRQRFAGRDVRIVRCDVRHLRLPRRPFRVVSSPPFAATTDTVRLLLASDRLLRADLVLQTGAVRRLVERPPARHSLYRLDAGRAIPRRAFAPPPRVDARILRITRR